LHENVRHEAQGETDDLKKHETSSSPGSGRVQKGAANVAGIETATCNSRAV
jgi:hypothetical protein